MGIDSYFFVGNFIRVPGVKKIIKNPDYRCSKGCTQKPAKGARFCSHCGAAVENRDEGKVELVKLSPYDLPPAFDEEAFYTREYCAGADKHEAVWIPNKGGWGVVYDAEGNHSAVTIDIDISAEREDFAAEFADLLAHIEKEYGVKPEVCWGVVPYAS